MSKSETRDDELTHDVTIAVGPNPEGLRQSAVNAQADAAKHREVETPDPAPAKARRTKGG